MRIGIVIGEPLDFSRYQGMENDRFILRSVTDEIMYAIMSLSGQEYVDVYAATQKARIATGHPAVAGDAADHLPGRPGRSSGAGRPGSGPAAGRARDVSRMTRSASSRPRPHGRRWRVA